MHTAPIYLTSFLVLSALVACGSADEGTEASADGLTAGSLAASWTFDETGGAVKDATGDGYTGWLGTTGATEASDPARVAGRYNGGLAFDGATRLVTIAGGTSPAKLNGSSSFTYAAWIKPGGWGGGGYGRIVSAESTKGFDDHYLYVTSGTLGARIADASGGHDTVAAAGAIALGAWQHVAITYDDAGDRKAHLYVNGSEVKSYAAEPAASGALVAATSSFTIGNRPARDRGFAGVLDDVRVYRVALSPSDVAQLASGAATTPPPASTSDAGTTTTSPAPQTPLAACPVATAATRYVSTTGSDSNAGTAASPFRSIQHAADVANPGDVVHVMPGTYTGTASPLGYIRRSGTASAPIVFCSEQPGAAKLDGQNTLSTGWYLEGSYIQVLGFDVSRFTGVGVSVWSTGDVVIGNHLHDIGRVCSDSSNGKCGIYSGNGSNLTVVGNTINTVGRFSPGEQGCSPTTSYYQNLDHGIYIEGTANMLVSDNVFYDHKHGWAIQVYSGAGAMSSNLTIVNNTFAGASPYRTGQLLFASPGVSTAVVENNIFYMPDTEGVRFTGPSISNVTVRNNLTTGAVVTASNPGSGVTLSANLDNTDAKLVSPSTFDFHLQAGSPAIDRGLTLSQVKTDLEGTARPQGGAFDVGAYEWH